MSKRILMFCDGTWNRPETDTNVYRMVKNIAITNDQVAYYDDGVGSDGLEIEKLFGGAMGIGLWGKVKDAYMKIAHAYDPDDEIFLFGFSRGAFTARAVVGMIAKVGLPTANFDAYMVDAAFDAYRGAATNGPKSLASVRSRYAMDDAKITMLGVWDTVGALGIPALIGGVDPILYGFLDTQLHPVVQNAYQACAIDERRREFPLTPMVRTAGDTQPCESVWFSGVHSDVGGGYLDDNGLAEITLRWMASKAAALGVQFVTPYEPLTAGYALAKLHESWSFLPWGFPKSRKMPYANCVSNSVKIREAYDMTYSPAELKASNIVTVDVVQEPGD